jgi:TP901 family phage tail tape measure protein
MAEQVVFFRVEADGVADLVDQLGLLRKQATELQRDMRKATDPADYVKLNRELENNRIEQKAITAAIKDNTKAVREQTGMALGSYRQLDSELGRLRRSYKELAEAERNGIAGKQTLDRIAQLDTQLKQIDASMGQFQRNVGNYPGSNLGKFAGGIAGLGGPIGNFVGNLQGMQSPLQDIAGGLGMTGTAGLAAAGGIAAAAVVIGKGVANAMEFETAFAQLSATLGVSGAEADALKERISELETITLTGGAQIVSTSSQIADALTVVGSAAPQLLKNQDALQAVTKEVIVFSKSAGTDLAGAAKVVTGAINLFGLEASEAARVVNVLAAGEKEGSASTLEAAAALETAGGAARISGVSIEETTAAIQLLAKDAIKGSEAGTALRNVFLKLATADTLPKAAQDAFKETGVNVQLLTDTTVPLTEKLNELRKMTGNTAALTQVFGTENVNAAISLTKYADEFPNLTAAITNTNVAYDQAGVKQETFGAKLENLSNKVNNLLTKVGEMFIPMLSALADIVTTVFDAFGEVNNAISDVVEEVTGATDATGLFGEVLSYLGSLIGKLMSVQFKAFVMAIRGIGATFAGIKAIIGDIPTAIGQLVEDGIDHISVFALKAKAAFANASNFITFGLAGGGEEFIAQADAIYNNMQERAKGNVDILGKFSAAFTGFLDKAKEKDELRKQAADQAAAAEEEAVVLADKLKADAEAEAERKKKAEEAAKKAAEEAKKRAEEERRNLNFLRAELVKVEEQLKKYADKSLIPTALLQSYNSLKNEIAGVEKQLAEMDQAEMQRRTIEMLVKFKAETEALDALGDDINDRPIELSVQIGEESIRNLEGQLDGLVDFTAKASQQSIVETQKALKTLDEIEAEDAQKRLEDEKNLREQIKKASITLAQDAADAIFEIESQNAERRIERRMEELEMQEAAQLALVEGNAQAEMQVREDYAAQREQLEREEFERKKRMDIAQAIMNGALGITAALVQVPAGFVMAALIAAQTAVQVATIAAQEFADGGLIAPSDSLSPKAESGIFVGPSHARGGINTRLSGRLVNVEGGEYYERLADGSSVVINKRSTGRFASALRAQAGKNYAGKLQALSAINEMGGGVPLFAMGGIVPPMGNAASDRQASGQMELLAMALSKIDNRVPVLTLQSFDTVNARANQVKTLQGL